MVLLPFPLLALAACDGQESTANVPAGQTATLECPLETRPPNAGGQTPAFPDQTRACGATSDVRFGVTVMATGLEHPWAVEPLPNGDLLVTERPGRLRLVTASGQVGAPISGLPPVDAGGQGGLLDVALSPDFVADRTIFWSFTESRPGGNGTAVARGVLAADNRSVGSVSVIFRAGPTYAGRLHFGARLAFGPDGTLYVSTGERSDTPMRMHAQRLDNHLGKILRINPDGSIPDDNPFVGQSGARHEIWSYGHRNTQALGFDSENRLWNVEHGTRGGDELNLVQPGLNFGWPIAAYGIEYRGSPIESAETIRLGTEQAVYYWDPVIAPSGLQWYSGDAFPEWRGDLFIGGMVATALVRLIVENDRVVGEEHLLKERRQRIRDVRQGPDGSLFVVTDAARGELWRISPAH